MTKTPNLFVVDLLKPRRAVLTGMQLEIMYNMVHEHILQLELRIRQGDLTEAEAHEHCDYQEHLDLRDYVAELQGRSQVDC